ncbi:MAG: D-alanyl-D-alanine carboxypeptidase [Saprospiraceae bacterium]|nr:D-alanyl-D-alanine carboxypeptidase [Saprospiraceae bacterium]
MTDSLVKKVFARYSKNPLIISDHCPQVDQKFFYSLPADTIYTAMMQHSDNFIAEQLLLTISGYLSDTMQTTLAIRDIKKNHLAPISDQLQWYDGSGLSRYNLFTPKAITTVLTKIYSILPIDQIKHIFAAGGVTGTIANWYKNENGPPFIYAKTGTLKNVHCLSGFIFTDSGNTLIFSFMNNNFRKLQFCQTWNGQSTSIYKISLLIPHYEDLFLRKQTGISELHFQLWHLLHKRKQ